VKQKKTKWEIGPDKDRNLNTGGSSPPYLWPHAGETQLSLGKAKIKKKKRYLWRDLLE